MDNEIPEEKSQFVEEIGLILEENGRPRIAGRIIGWLLICDPPHQSFNDLVEALDVSKASVSSMTRLMLESDLIERTTLPGDRRTYFRIRKDAWKHVLEKQLRLTHRFSRAAQHGLDFLENQPPEKRRRLEELRDVMKLMARRFEEEIAAYASAPERGSKR